VVNPGEQLPLSRGSHLSHRTSPARRRTCPGRHSDRYSLRYKSARGSDRRSSSRSTNAGPSAPGDGRSSPSSPPSAVTAAACTSGTSASGSTNQPRAAPAGSGTDLHELGERGALTVSSGSGGICGNVLTGPNGHTLYHLTTETAGRSIARVLQPPRGPPHGDLR